MFLASFFLMLTRLKLKKQGELVEPRFQIVSRRRNTSQDSIVMTHEEGPKGMSKYERTFEKTFFKMSEMIKVLYKVRNSRLYGEISKPPTRDGGKRNKSQKMNGENGDKPPTSPPS